MHRLQIKGGGGLRKPSSPDTEPNFYKMPYLPEEDGATSPAQTLASKVPLIVMDPSPPTDNVTSVELVSPERPIFPNVTRSNIWATDLKPPTPQTDVSGPLKRSVYDRMPHVVEPVTSSAQCCPVAVASALERTPIFPNGAAPTVRGAPYLQASLTEETRSRVRLLKRRPVVYEPSRALIEPVTPQRCSEERTAVGQTGSLSVIVCPSHSYSDCLIIDTAAGGDKSQREKYEEQHPWFSSLDEDHFDCQEPAFEELLDSLVKMPDPSTIPSVSTSLVGEVSAARDKFLLTDI